MTENIIDFKPRQAAKPLPKPSAAQREMIKFLETALEEVRRNEVTGLVLLTEHPAEEWRELSVTEAGVNWIGRLECVKMKILNEYEGRT